MSDDQKYMNLLKSSDDNTMNVPKIYLLPQAKPIYPENVSAVNTYPLSINPLANPGNYKFSHRDSGTCDSLSMGSKVNINSQIKTIHNWFKHLPGSDQARLMATLFPSVHFDYMAMIASIASKQANYISNEVLDYQKLEEEANNFESLSRLTEEPSILAVNLLSRLPLLYPCAESETVGKSASGAAAAAPVTKNSSSACVHRLYAKLLTQVFLQDFSDLEEVLAVKQLATLATHHPNLQASLQAKLTELAIERQLLDEKEDTRRPRRPGALSPFGPPGHIAQTHSFSLLVPPFLAAGCLSATASPQSACSYNSSGFISGAESCGRRTQPPLSPQSSTSSCAGDDQILSHSVSYDHEPGAGFLPGGGFPQGAGFPPGANQDGSDSSSGDGRTASLQGQSSIDTPTPSSASSVLLVSKQMTTCSPCTVPCDCIKSSASLALRFSDSISFFVKDDEVDSEASFSMNRDSVDSDRNTFLEKGSGMSYVPSWLKSLRLHKYAGLFQQLTYDEMLSITDEWLESKNVTKGARNKILVNIQKLETRQSTLRQAEAELVSSGSVIALRTCINEIRHILMTPIKPFSDADCTYVCSSLTGSDSPPNSINGNVLQGDLPNQIVRCLSRVCSQILVSKKIDEESHLMFLQILDTIIEHESFTVRHKNLCRSWRGQLESTRGPPRKMSSWIESQRGGYRKSGGKHTGVVSAQSCSFPNVSSAMVRPGTPSCPIAEPYCPILAPVPFSPIPSVTRPPVSFKDAPLPQLPFPMPGLGPLAHPLSHQHQQLIDLSSQVLVKRQVERTLSAPNQSALMDLFLQCQSYLPQNVEQPPPGCLEKLPPVSIGQIYSVPLGSSSSFRMTPPWPPVPLELGALVDKSASSMTQPAAGVDTSPSGSQDPVTAEINWNLDLLAREVTELAIRDPESPDKL